MQGIDMIQDNTLKYLGLEHQRIQQASYKLLNLVKLLNVSRSLGM